MSPRGVRAGVAAAMLAVFLVALSVFLLPFAFPTPAPIVTRFQTTRLFSPEGDGRRELARVNVRMAQRGAITIDVERDGEQVRRLIAADDRPRGWVRRGWDGRDADGRRVPDGDYAIKLRVRSGEKQFNTTRTVTVDTAAPRPAAFSVRSATLDAPGAGECRVSFESADAGQLTLEARAPGADGAIRRLGPRPIRAGGSLTWNWDGTRAGGRPVAPGVYRIRAILADAARNRVERERTCWVGRLAGTATGDVRPGGRVGVRLRRTDGSAVPARTPVRLQLRRRTGVPGRRLTDPLGAAIARGARGPAGRVSLRLPRGIAPDALWLVARTPGGAALVPLGDVP